MKKNKFIVFYVILSSVLFVLALGFLGYNLYNEYNHGYERTKRRFDHMTNNFKKLSEKETLSFENYKIELDKTIGELSDFSYIEIKENGKTIYIYPEASAQPVQDSKLIKNYFVAFTTKEINYFISADLYILRPYTIFYCLRITFLIVLIITIITAILIIYYNLSDKKISEFSQEETENIEDNVFEQDVVESMENTEENILEQNEYIIEKEETQNENFENKDTLVEEQNILPTGDFEPVHIQTLQEDNNLEPSGLFSPSTGLGWKQYLKTRLDNELSRAIASEFDLSLFLIKIPGFNRESEQIKKCSEYLIDQFQFKDLLFEYKDDCIAAIKINTDLETALTFADKIYIDLKHIIGASNNCFIGITTRTIRMISSDRLILEAEEALKHAQENPEDPIIAFRANAEKYRQFIEQN